MSLGKHSRSQNKMNRFECKGHFWEAGAVDRDGGGG